MSAAYLDTHIAVYLYAGLIEELSRNARRAIEESDLLISPIVLLELGYLFARGKISVEPDPLINTLASDFGVAVCDVSFATVVRASWGVTWTSDPFDRLIVAQAIANRSAPLITKDRLMRRHHASAVW